MPMYSRTRATTCSGVPARARFAMSAADMPQAPASALEARLRPGRIGVDDDAPEPGFLDRVVAAPLGVAVRTQHVELVAELVDRAAVVPDVGVARDETEEDLLAAAADEDRRMRLAHRLRIAPRLAAPGSGAR